MRLADFVIEKLESYGIDHAMMVVGGGAIFLNDAIRKAKRMKPVCFHHEQAAAMAAESYARVRNGIGCTIVTSGPGGTNAITGVAGHWTDSVPTITISGQVFSKQTKAVTGQPLLRSLGVQEIDIIELVRPITKAALILTEPDMIRYHLERLLWIAHNGRPGPVWLDLPADIQNAQVDPETMMGFNTPSQEKSPADKKVFAIKVREVVELLKAAKRPLIHIGQGIRIADAEEELFAFAEGCGIPIVTARNGADIIPDNHPLYVGRPGTFAQRGANFAVQTCDLYIAIGTRLSLAQTGYNAKDYARNAKIVQVDIDRVELAKDTLKPHLAIHADAKEFLIEILKQIMMQKNSFSKWLSVDAISDSGRYQFPTEWRRKCKSWLEKYPPGEPRERVPGYVNSYDLIDTLSEVLTSDDVIVTDMGFAFQNTFAAFRIKKGQRLITNTGLASMGWGLPGAIGAAIGSGRRVIAIIGDGGMMMNLQELATLAHHGLNVKIFLLDNNGYLTMRQSQSYAFGGYMGSDPDSGLSFPEFHTLFSAFDITRFVMSSVDVGTIKMFLDMDGPGCAIAHMDPNQETIPKSLNQRMPDGSIRQTTLEDSYPFLPAEEIAEQMKVADP